MFRDEALRILGAHKAELAQMGVKAVFLFGSTARDEARPDSDVDLVVEIDHERSRFGLLALLRLRERLEELVGRRVDLIEREAIHPAFRDAILREAIRAA